ncbi:uncharacterized protein LOC128982935 [Macrosteles quadrilineatus]|uniref:uncharacterized protein LOC128982935 n=1 Tax=Macrosteles quadrilineatus TaxID=74068 RepID=UPI0023E233C7|nr:uncharacterized protein LOC128982935 [Macrosteles quadrilineatus]
MRHQFQSLKSLKNSISEHESIIIIDFSENYETKYSKEVQSVHFGGSKTQVSIQTGVCFFVNSSTKKICIKQFATVSDNCSHKAPAVWAHLLPVLKWVMTNLNPNINTIYIQSDGPTSQYKNKINLFLMTHFAEILKLSSFIWNFTEPGHGKSLADAVGGQLKRFCDQQVLYGNDILNAKDVYNSVKSSAQVNVEVFLIGSKDIDDVEKLVPGALKPIPNTLKLRQVLWKNDKQNRIFLRQLTCLQCVELCKHYALPSPHYFKEADHSVATTSRERLHTYSDYDEDSTLEPITPLPDVINDLSVGDFILVRFSSKKTFKLYVGQVISKYDDGDFEVKFLRKTVGNKFVFPQAEDIASVQIQDVIQVLTNFEKHRDIYSFHDLSVNSNIY